MGLSILLTDEDKEKIDSASIEALEGVYGDFLQPISAEVEVSLVSLEEIQLQNQQSRGIDEPTDVLSFPIYTDKEAMQGNNHGFPLLLGSILISPEKALLYNETVPQLIHHGLLHICGYDHESDILAWNTVEEVILQKLAAANLVIPGIPL